MSGWPELYFTRNVAGEFRFTKKKKNDKSFITRRIHFTLLACRLRENGANGSMKSTNGIPFEIKTFYSPAAACRWRTDDNFAGIFRDGKLRNFEFDTGNPLTIDYVI